MLIMPGQVGHLGEPGARGGTGGGGGGGGGGASAADDPDTIYLGDFTSDGNILVDESGTLTALLEVEGVRASYDTGDAPATLSGAAGSERFDGNWNLRTDPTVDLPSADYNWGSGDTDLAVTWDFWIKFDFGNSADRFWGRGQSGDRDAIFRSRTDRDVETLFTDDGSNFDTFLSTLVNKADDTWYLLTFQWEGGIENKVHMWLDGVYQESPRQAHVAGIFWNSLRRWNLGAAEDAGRLRGNIAQARIVKRALYTAGADFTPGDLTVMPAVTTPLYIGHDEQYTAGSVVTLNVPDDVQDDDFMMVLLSADGSGPETITPPAGWTEARAPTLIGDPNGGDTVAAYYRVASSEPASYAWTWTGGDSDPVAGMLMAFRNINTADPFDVSDFQVESLGTTTHTFDEITTTVADAMLVGMRILPGPDGFTSTTPASPGNGTFNADVINSGNGGASGFSLYAGYGFQATAGLTGDQLLGSPSSRFSTGWYAALKPAP